MVFKGDGIKQLTDSSFSVVRIQPRPQGFSLKKWPHPFFQGKALGTRLVRIIGQRKVLSIQVFRFKGRKYSLLWLLGDLVAFTDLFIYLKISMRREKNVVSRLGMRIFPCRDFHKRNLATVNSFMAERQLCDHSTDFIIHYTRYLYSYWLRTCR